jgi:hypothetical protein
VARLVSISFGSCVFYHRLVKLSKSFNLEAGGVTPNFKVKTECILLCVSGSIFTHKVTNSEINSITCVYYNVS